jgi:hypothetical protein
MEITLQDRGFVLTLWEEPKVDVQTTSLARYLKGSGISSPYFIIIPL